MAKKEPKLDKWGNKIPSKGVVVMRRVVNASEVPSRILRAAASKIEKKLGDD